MKLIAIATKLVLDNDKYDMVFLNRFTLIGF
ncbi:MAG: hypothetical protein ACI84F_000398 [Pseudoalteromonas tetraodonis]